MRDAEVKVRAGFVCRCGRERKRLSLFLAGEEVEMLDRMVIEEDSVRRWRGKGSRDLMLDLFRFPTVGDRDHDRRGRGRYLFKCCSRRMY